jgi:effector-binding domain-containing protein
VVERKHLPARHLAVTRFRASFTEIGKRIGSALTAVHQALVAQGIRVQGPAIAVYHKQGDGFEIAAGFEVANPIVGSAEIEPAELPACEAVVTTHMGDYADLPAAYDAMRAWMTANGREPAETMWEEYWSDPSTPPDRTRTDVFWPLAPK